MVASAQPGAAGPTPPGGAPRTGREIVELVGSVIAPVTIITALLYYFGWIREGAVFGYFGVDQTTLGFSTTDYLLRSAFPAFKPIVFAVLLGIAGLGALMVARRIIGGRAGWQVRIAAVAGFVGTLLIGYSAAVLAGWRRLPASPVNAPLALAGGVILAGCAVSLAGRVAGNTLGIGSRSLLIALGAVAMFWGTSIYAQRSGAKVAQDIASGLRNRAGVVVWSHDDLNVSGPGVSAARLGQSAAGYRYRYSGLRLLVYARNRYLLLPEGWTRASRAPLFVLSDVPTVRVDYLPPG